MGSVYEYSLIGEDLLRHIVISDDKDIDKKFKVGEPAFIDCSQLAMQSPGIVDVVVAHDEKGVNAESVGCSHDILTCHSDDLATINRTLAMPQHGRQIDDKSALVPDDVGEPMHIAKARSDALQTSLPGSHHYWLMRRELLKLVEVHPVLEGSVSIPSMHEQESKRWACVNAVMQGEKYLAYCVSGKRIPRHPDPCDRTISKRSWEKSMRNWRQALGDL